MNRGGTFVDRATQLWVRSAREPVDFSRDSWLDGPFGEPERIGEDFFRLLAEREDLVDQDSSGPAGLLESFDELCGEGLPVGNVHPEVVRFYEETSEYELDLWSEWNGLFRPFGWLLAVIFSRRLQQLNIPLSPLDTSRGMMSQVVKLVDRSSGRLVHTGWVRTNPANQETIYVGAYSAASIPNRLSPCVKVVFPLPNGSASVLMSAKSDSSGALILESSGSEFGDPGFYFVIRGAGNRGWVRYVRTFRERIRVFVDGDDELRTDHEFTIWGLSFLRLHYRMRRAAA
jgi:hypothetical protein